MLPVWLRDVFQTGSLLLGIRMLSAIQWGPSLHLVPISAHSSGQLFFLGSSSAAWEQPWFCSWLSGDSELPSTWKYHFHIYIWKYHFHIHIYQFACPLLCFVSSLQSACGCWLLFILKSELTPPEFFSEAGEGAFTIIPFLWQNWSGGNQYKWSDRELEWYSCLQSYFLCVYMCILRYVHFMIWSFLLQKKNDSQSAGSGPTSVIY